MKLLLDNNLSYKLCKPLEQFFPLSAHVNSVLTFNAADLEIWSFANEHNYTILTKDNDFNELSLLKGCPPKIVHLLCGNATTSEILLLLNISADAILNFDKSQDCVLKIYP